MKVNGYCYKGRLWGRPGYQIAIGIEDGAFYFGTLREAKAAAVAARGADPKNINWIDMGAIRNDD